MVFSILGYVHRHYLPPPPLPLLKKKKKNSENYILLHFSCCVSIRSVPFLSKLRLHIFQRICLALARKNPNTSRHFPPTPLSPTPPLSLSSHSSRVVCKKLRDFGRVVCSLELKQSRRILEARLLLLLLVVKKLVYDGHLLGSR